MESQGLVYLGHRMRFKVAYTADEALFVEGANMKYKDYRIFWQSRFGCGGSDRK